MAEKRKRTAARKRRTSSSSRGRKWDKLIRSLPGFDPFKDAEGFTFDRKLADRVCDFFETQLFIIEGKDAGQPFKLMDWQAAFLGNLFGWIDARGVRRFRESMLYIPKKNGKSPLCGGILDYVLLCDGEPGAQCYCAAADRDQANIVFRHARGMIQRNPELEAHVTIYDSTKTIMFCDSFAKVISAEAASKHGYNSQLVLIDELHAQPDRDLVDVLSNSISSRTQPLVIHITTADYDRPSICNDKYDYAKKVMSGVIRDPRFLPVIYDLEEGDDWESEENWKRANPSLGKIKSLDYMRREAERAKNEPSYRETFRRLELNQRTKTFAMWLNLQRWDACPDADTGHVAKLKAWGGLDLSSTQDTTAFTLCWPMPDGKFAFKTTIWIPEDTARRKEKEDRVPYLAWHDQGFINFTPGEIVDYTYIRAHINAAAKQWQLQDVGFDSWNATQLALQLQNEDGINMVEFGQGYKSMSPAAKEFEKLIMSAALAHVERNQALRWMAGNAVVITDPAGNIKPDKSKAVHRIDGIISCIMALGRAMSQSVMKRSVYETRGIRTI